MRILIKRECLLLELNKISRIANNRSLIPANSGILFNISADKIVLTGSDENIFIKSEIDKKNILSINVQEKENTTNQSIKKFLVKAKIINEIIKKIESEMITLEIVDNILKITDENYEAQLNIMNDEGYYDEISFQEDGEKYQIPSNLFKEIISQVGFAVASKENQPNLAGICFKNANKKFKVIATDASRIAQREFNNYNFENDFEKIIPSKVLQELAKIINDNSVIDFILNQEDVIFKFNNTILKTKIIKTIYPNIDFVVAQAEKAKTRIKINLYDILNTIDRVGILLNENLDPTMKMRITKEEIEIKTNVSEICNSNEIIKEFKFESEIDEQNIAFNYQYMLSALKAFKSKEISLSIINNISPIIITSEKEPGLVQVVLPVRTFN